MGSANKDSMTPSVISAAEADYERNLANTVDLIYLLANDPTYATENRALFQCWLAKHVELGEKAADALQPLWSKPHSKPVSFQDARSKSHERLGRTYNIKGVNLYTAEWNGAYKGWRLNDPDAYRCFELCEKLGVKNMHVHKGPTIIPLNKDAFDVHAGRASCPPSERSCAHEIADDVPLRDDHVDCRYADVLAVTDDVIASHRASHFQALRGRALLADEVDDRLRALAARQLQHRFDLVAVGLHELVRSDLLGELKRGLRLVDHDDVGRRHCARALDADVPDAPSADHDAAFSGIELARHFFHRAVGGEPGVRVGRDVLRGERLGQGFAVPGRHAIPGCRPQAQCERGRCAVWRSPRCRRYIPRSPDRTS
jgi:hypothetical protein